MILNVKSKAIKTALTKMNGILVISMLNTQKIIEIPHELNLFKSQIQ